MKGGQNETKTEKGPSSSAFKKLLSVYMHNPLIMLNKMTRFHQGIVIDTFSTF